MKKRIIIFLSLFCSVLYLNAASIVGISIPANSMDASCHPTADNIWTSNPLNINSGIGYIVNPTLSYSASDYSLHDHVYISSYIPDPTRAVVTYEFDASVTVHSLTIIQHTSGITQIEGFVGNSLSVMTSIGLIFGPSGNFTGGFTEYLSQTFNFGNDTVTGKYFQFIVRKTSIANGWATYRAIPNFTTAVPEPSTFISFGIAGIGLLLGRLQASKK